MSDATKTEMARAAAEAEYRAQALQACEMAGRGIGQVYDRLKAGYPVDPIVMDVLVVQKYINDAAFTLMDMKKTLGEVAPAEAGNTSSIVVV